MATLDIVVTRPYYQAIQNLQTQICPKPLTAWLWERIIDKKNRPLKFDHIRFICDREKSMPILKFQYQGFVLSFEEYVLRVKGTGGFKMPGTHIQLHFSGKPVEEFDHNHKS